MKITCYLSTNTREQEIGRVLRSGFDRAGDDAKLALRSDFWAISEEHGEATVDPEADVICFIGVKSKKMFDACKAQDKIPLLIDKGYFGRGEMYRMSLGAYQPPYLDQIIADLWDDPVMFRSRLEACGVRVQLHQNKGRHSVMYVGSSQKYCNFHELGDNNDYSRKVVTELTGFWPHQIIYRPKPSWWTKMKSGERRDDLQDIPRVSFSGSTEPFAQVLRQCHAVVTHGSNGAAEALAAGVPVIMLSEEGVSSVWPLCSHSLADVLDINLPGANERERILAAMAWSQFSIPEMATGFAWRNLRHWWGKYEEANPTRGSG
jgi:hypothetical protein